jgi:ribosomal protein S18 acetylase RimI-like enzyme
VPLTTDLTLRRATLDELPRVADFWLAMFEEVGKHHRSDFRPDWRDRYVAYFRRRIEDEDAAYFVAVDGDAIAGCSGALMSEGYPAEIHGIRKGYVFGVYVLPEYRGRGLATALTTLAIEFLQQRSAKTIELHASPYGRPIYEKLGFEPTNEMRLIARLA